MKSALSEKFQAVLLAATGASSMEVLAVIQELWSGYGQILRVALQGGSRESVVVKHVQIPQDRQHPRGWTSDLSHARKIASYQVESRWYQAYSSRCDENCRMPECLAYEGDAHQVLLVLEDLDTAGFPARLASVDKDPLEACLRWLAEFHACFMGEQPEGLWETGTYWHLQTRPEELEALDDPALKAAAPLIDRRLSAARYQTFVHGDAKLANFCFSPSGERVAAVDFQYVGGGCGMKDVAYFIGSCLDETACAMQVPRLLDFYFESLRSALMRRRSGVDAGEVIAEWRSLFPLAWTDFHRFLKGWCPQHWKINSYSEQLAREVLAQLPREPNS